jgi:anti-sigma B factor antagonist
MNTIISYNDDGFALVKIDIKRFDFDCAQEAKKIVLDIIENKSKKIILDLSAMEFMDSAGLSVIVSIFKKITQVEGVLKLSSLASQPFELIHVIGLDKLLTLLDCDGRSCDDGDRA